MGTVIVRWWWFVLKGDEDVLSTLEKWEQVQLQTNWKLQPLLTLSDSDELVDSVTPAEDQSNPNSNSESF